MTSSRTSSALRNGPTTRSSRMSGDRPRYAARRSSRGRVIGCPLTLLWTRHPRDLPLSRRRSRASRRPASRAPRARFSLSCARREVERGPGPPPAASRATATTARSRATESRTAPSSPLTELEACGRRLDKNHDLGAKGFRMEGKEEKEERERRGEREVAGIVWRGLTPNGARAPRRGRGALQLRLLGACLVSSTPLPRL